MVEAGRRLLSFGGGIPETGDNPLRYKISWTWEGVLHSYVRPARLVQDGRLVELPAEAIFDERFTRTVTVPPLGKLEAFPNGDVRYVRDLGIEDSVTTAGRYALRWPGHCRLWKTWVDLGFLDQTPVPGLPGNVSPRQFMLKHLEPRLQYEPDQRDVAILRVEAEGVSNGARRVVFEVVDYRDIATGLTAMSRTVGFAASIAARMIAGNSISARGLLSPARHVPFAPFVAELRRHGIIVREETTPSPSPAT